MLGEDQYCFKSQTGSVTEADGSFSICLLRGCLSSLHHAEVSLEPAWDNSREMSPSRLYYFIRLHLASCLALSLLLALKKQVSILWTVCGGTHVAKKLQEACLELRAIVLQLQGTEVCQQPKWASKWTLPKPNLKMRTQPSHTLVATWSYSEARNLAKPCMDP